MEKVWNKLSVNRKKEVKVLMLGLNAAGKTTILYYLKLGKETNQLPTVGYNVESIEWQRLKFVIWDISGKNKKTSLHEQLQEHYRNAKALIFVIDSKDSDRMPICKEELKIMLDNEKLDDVTFLILANKQDLPGAMTVSEVREMLDVGHILHRDVHVVGTSAPKGAGLEEGLSWLEDKLMEKDQDLAAAKRRSKSPFS